MKRTWILALSLGILAPIGLIGCNDETTKVEDKKTIETPGGKVTEKDTKEITREGDAKTTP